MNGGPGRIGCGAPGCDHALAFPVGASDQVVADLFRDAGWVIYQGATLCPDHGARQRPGRHRAG